MSLNKEAVEEALRTVIEWVDYDLHKALEDGAEDCDEPEDRYPSLAARFIEGYEAEGAAS